MQQGGDGAIKDGITKDELQRVCLYLLKIRVLTHFWVAHILAFWDEHDEPGK